MNDVDESLKLMDYSLRSLQRNSGSQSEQNKARREENRNDK